MLFMKPGDQFQGSIYAPASLVVLRVRACSIPPHSWANETTALEDTTSVTSGKTTTLQ